MMNDDDCKNCEDCACALDISGKDARDRYDRNMALLARVQAMLSDYIDEQLAAGSPANNTRADVLTTLDLLLGASYAQLHGDSEALGFVHQIAAHVSASGPQMRLPAGFLEQCAKEARELKDAHMAKKLAENPNLC
jgi:hypothetical protein